MSSKIQNTKFVLEPKLLIIRILKIYIYYSKLYNLLSIDIFDHFSKNSYVTLDAFLPLICYQREYFDVFSVQFSSKKFWSE